MGVDHRCQRDPHEQEGEREARRVDDLQTAFFGRQRLEHTTVEAVGDQSLGHDRDERQSHQQRVPVERGRSSGPHGLQSGPTFPFVLVARRVGRIRLLALRSVPHQRRRPDDDERSDNEKNNHLAENREDPKQNGANLFPRLRSGTRGRPPVGEHRGEPTTRGQVTPLRRILSQAK